MEKGKITLLHSYHYEKVSSSDKEAFCKLSGQGVISIGIADLCRSKI